MELHILHREADKVGKVGKVGKPELNLPNSQPPCQILLVGRNPTKVAAVEPKVKEGEMVGIPTKSARTRLRVASERCMIG